MISQCTHCGAPLDVRQPSGNVKCRYCGVQNQPRQMPVLSPQTPTGWKAPRTWTPPPQFSAPSNVPLRYHRQANPIAVVAGVIVPVVVTLAVAGSQFAIRSSLSRSSGGSNSVGGGKESPSSSLDALTMAETESTMRTRYPGYTTFSDRTVVHLSDGPFANVTFEWRKEEPDHVARFSFSVREGAQIAPVCANLKKQLPVHWNGDTYLFGGLQLYCGGTTLHGGGQQKVVFSPNPHWRKQTAMLWKAVLQASYGRVKVSPTEARTWLGTGYPLNELGKVDFGADVDGATAAMQAVFPAAAPNKHVGLNFEVAIDHPWYGEAELQWPNRKGGKLEQVSIRPRPSIGRKFAQQEAISGCIERAFGMKPRIYESDHLAKTRDYDFMLKGGGEVRVYEHMVAIWSDRRGGLSKDNYLKILSTLDACGRGR